MKSFTLTFLIILAEFIMPQEFNFEQSLYNDYEIFKEQTLISTRFTHSDVQPLINRLKDNKDFSVNKVGESFEGRDISLISLGHGKRKIFLWSQMHGDEPTATAALFDIFKFFSADSHPDIKQKILNNVKIYFLPMVNPDGAEKFQRRNIIGIDINRDAARLQTPEALVLREVFDSLKAEFGFNLHDQDPRYSVGNSFKSAAISFLAPAFNYEKDIDSVREKSILLIGRLTRMLTEFIPGHIAKYSDDYEPRAFGDKFQQLGTSTILVESGGWKDDIEKQFLRKLNFVLLLSAFNSIAENNYKSESPDVYESIPFNDKYLFDVLVRNLTLEKNGRSIKLDVAINFEQVTLNADKTFYRISSVQDIGDLSIFYGYNDLDLAGYKIMPGKIYKEKSFSLKEIEQLHLGNYHADGFIAVLTNEDLQNKFINKPINVMAENSGREIDFLKIGKPANFILTKDNKVDYIIINGFVYKTSKNGKFEGNGLIYK